MVSFKGFFLSVLIFLTVDVYAVDGQFTASVSKTNLVLGEIVTLSLSAENIDVPNPPAIPHIKGLKITYRNVSRRSSSSISFDGGRRSRKRSVTTIFTYDVIAQKIGRFEIPSVPIVAGKNRYRTAPIVLSVSKRSSSAERDVFIEISLDTDRCYIGQPIVFELKWYFSKQIEDYRLTIPFLPSVKNFLVKDIELDTRSKRYVKIMFNKQVTEYFEESQEIINGKKFVTLTLRKIIVPVAAGTYTFDPVTLVCKVLKGYQRRYPIIEQRMVNTKQTSVNVARLPFAPSGFPDDISIGKFKMSTKVTPKKVNVGDPVTVTVTVSGEGNIESIPSPKISNTKDFRIFEEDAETDVVITRRGISGRKIFKILFIPLSERVKFIPPVSVACFDTKKNSYSNLSSKPVPITVFPSEGTGNAVIISGEDTDFGKKEVRLLYNDLPGFIMYKIGSVVTDESFVYNKVYYLLLFVVPFLLNILFSIYAKHYRKLKQNSCYRRKIQAKKLASKRIKKLTKVKDEQFYSSLIHILNEYIGDKLNIPSAGLTESTVKTKLKEKKIDESLINKVTEIYHRADMARFMPSTTESQKIEQDFLELKSIIGFLEKCDW